MRRPPRVASLPVPTGWSTLRQRFAQRANDVSAVRAGGRTDDAEGLRGLGRRAPPRADRPVQDPPARAPARPWRCGRRSSRSSRFVEGGARVFRKLHTPGFEGWTVSRYRQTERAHARGRSRDHPRGHGPRRRRRPGAAPEPVAVRALHRPPRAVDRPRPRLQRLRRSSGSRRTSTGWRRPRPIPLTDIDDAVAEIERVAAGGFQAVLLPATAADAVLLARATTRCGPPSRPAA